MTRAEGQRELPHPRVTRRGGTALGARGEIGQLLRGVDDAGRQTPVGGEHQSAEPAPEAHRVAYAGGLQIPAVGRPTQEEPFDRPPVGILPQACAGRRQTGHQQPGLVRPDRPHAHDLAGPPVRRLEHPSDPHRLGGRPLAQPHGATGLGATVQGGSAQGGSAQGGWAGGRGIKAAAPGGPGPGHERASRHGRPVAQAHAGLPLHAHEPVPAQAGQQVQHPGHAVGAVGHHQHVVAQGRWEQGVCLQQQPLELRPVLAGGQRRVLLPGAHQQREHHAAGGQPHRQQVHDGRLAGLIDHQAQPGSPSPVGLGPRRRAGLMLRHEGGQQHRQQRLQQVGQHVRRVEAGIVQEAAQAAPNALRLGRRDGQAVDGAGQVAHPAGVAGHQPADQHRQPLGRRLAVPPGG
ncbi:MAG: hypothetical protein HY332_01135 [Chloroflexi bacterium]|nr:hypothetical protein [Chloroflexota bacterium]